MKTIAVTDIPENQYQKIVDFLNSLKVHVVEIPHADYKLSDSDTQLMEERLRYYLENPHKVKDFDKSLDDIENDL